MNEKNLLLHMVINPKKKLPNIPQPAITSKILEDSDTESSSTISSKSSSNRQYRSISKDFEGNDGGGGGGGDGGDDGDAAGSEDSFILSRKMVKEKVRSGNLQVGMDTFMFLDFDENKKLDAKNIAIKSGHTSVVNDDESSRHISSSSSEQHRSHDPNLYHHHHHHSKHQQRRQILMNLCTKHLIEVMAAAVAVAVAVAVVVLVP